MSPGGGPACARCQEASSGSHTLHLRTGRKEHSPAAPAQLRLPAVDASIARTSQITTLSRKHYKIERCLPPFHPSFPVVLLHYIPGKVSCRASPPPPLRRDGSARILSSDSRSGLCASEPVPVGPRKNHDPAEDRRTSTGAPSPLTRDVKLPGSSGAPNLWKFPWSSNA